MAYDYTAAGAYIKAEPYARNVRDKIGDTFLAIPGTIQENTDATFQNNKVAFESEILADLEPTAVAAEVIAARAAYANLNARLNALVPASGIIEMFAGSAAPTGYMICDGAAISRTAYAALYAAIGTTYGAGNGSTTFNIPNLKGRVVVGKDASQTEFDVLGETGGAKTHTLTVAQLPARTYASADDALQGAEGSSGHWMFDSNYNGQGLGQAHNNLQPYLTLNYIIKY